MTLSLLTISDLRNISSTSIQPGSRLNVFWGRNGSGKSSILEAIYLLGRGRSFRSAYSSRIVRNGQNSVTVFGRSSRPNKPEDPLGIQIKEGRFKAKLNGQYLKKTSDLATVLPLLLITPDGDRLIRGSPRQRRRFLDWGLFHVEQSFLDVWGRFNRTLVQRNASLRLGKGAISAWNQQLIACATELDELRTQYCQQFIPLVNQIFAMLTDGVDLQIEYKRGWRQGISYQEALEAGIDIDIKAGFTQRGPHRADLQLVSASRKAGEILSGGQQKLAACALLLAQAQLYSARSDRPCLILVDDLPSELDNHHRKIFLDLLYSTHNQLFVTCTDKNLLDLSGYQEVSMFHVEHGSVSCE